MFEEKKEEVGNESALNDILKTEHRKVVENIFDSSKEKIVTVKKITLFQKILVALILILFVSVGVLFFVFNKFNKTVDTNVVSADYSNKIVINIDSPAGVAPDGQIEYFLSFKNTESYKMKNIDLSVRFPTEFSYISSDLDPKEINDQFIKWSFDSLNPGEEKKISLKGTLFGSVGSESVLSASMDYNFETISSGFTSNNSYKIVINKSVFDVVVDRSDIFFKGKDIVYKIKIKNNSDKALKNVKVSFKYPDFFKISKYSEDPTKIYKDEQSYWVFDLNKKQEDKTDPSVDDYYEKVITITGTVDSDTITEVNTNISAGIVEDMGNVDNANSTFSKDDTIRTSTSGLNFNIKTSSDITGDGVDRVSVANVDTPYKIAFNYSKTNKDLSFKDLRLVVEFLGDDIINPKINFSTVPKFTNNTTGDASNYIVEWNCDNNSGFKDVGDVAKDLSMTLSFKKDILTKFKDGGYYTNVKITLFGKNGSSKDETVLIDNKMFKIVLDSDTNIKTTSSKVSLKNGVKSDRIELSLNIANNYNKLTGSAIYFTLPDGTDFSTDYVTSKATKFDYDQTTRKVSWVIGDIDPFENDVYGKFYINIIPDSKSIGKMMDLTSKINFIYHDDTLNKDFSIDVNPVKSISKVAK